MMSSAVVSPASCSNCDSSSTVTTAIVLGQFGEPGDLRGQIDFGRAPGDASTAPDAPGTAELIVPCAEFVAEPLPVPALAGLPHTATVQIGEVQFEARRPVLPPLGMVAGEIGDVLGARAVAGRAHHGAVPTGQAPACDV